MSSNTAASKKKAAAKVNNTNQTSQTEDNSPNTVNPIVEDEQKAIIACLLTSSELLGHGKSWNDDGHITTTKSDDEIYTYIMEWMAQCFVLEERGDVVAVASKLDLGSRQTSSVKPVTPKVVSYASVAAASKTVVAAPKTVVAVPKTVVAAPKTVVAAPKTVVAVPKTVVAVPKTVVAVPKTVVAAPETVVAAPETVLAKITLLITNNKGNAITSQNKTFTKAFLEVLNAKIVLAKEETFYKEKTNVDNGVTDLMKVVVEHGWKRISAKIVRVQEMLELKDGTSKHVHPDAFRLDLLLSAYEDLFKEEDFPLPGGPLPSSAPATKKSVEQKSRIQVFFENMIGNVMEAKPKQVSDKLTFIRNLCNSCKHLVHAIDVVTKVDSQIKINLSNVHPSVQLAQLKKLRRRLWRILRYSAGAQIFLKNARRIIRNKVMAKSDGNLDEITIDCRWVAEESSSGTSVLTSLFTTSKKEIQVLKEDYEAWYKTTFTSKGQEPNSEAIVNYCKKNSPTKDYLTWRPSLHCEVILLLYLYLTQTPVISNAIGVSKLNCFACSIYTEELKYAFNGPNMYKMTGTSGKAHHQWLIPNASIFKTLTQQEGSKEAVQKVIFECKEDILSYLSNPNGDKRHSMGSDSSTGSGGMSALSVALWDN